MAESEVVQCWIYRSERKLETYIYLAKEDGADAVPEGLLAALGPLTYVMQLDLHEHRPLARVDVLQVMQDLVAEGFFLQMPPSQLEKLNPAVTMTSTARH